MSYQNSRVPTYNDPDVKVDDEDSYSPEDDGAKDVFVHISNVEKSGLISLKEGQKVSFEIAQNKGKFSAVNIKLLP